MFLTFKNNVFGKMEYVLIINFKRFFAKKNRSSKKNSKNTRSLTKLHKIQESSAIIVTVVATSVITRSGDPPFGHVTGSGTTWGGETCGLGEKLAVAGSR